MSYRSGLLLVLLVATLSGCSRKPDDSALVTNIKAQLFSDAQMKGASLDVNSTGGEVTLKGAVPTDAARYEAYKIATQTPGVTKVNDQMSVQQPVAAAVEPPPPAPPPAAEPKPVHHAEPAPTHRVRQKKAGSTADSVQSADNVQQPVPPDQSNSQPVPLPNTSAATATPAPAAAPPPPPPPPPQPRRVVIPASSTVTIRMIDGVDSSVNHAGEIFHASLEAPIVVDNDVIVPKGADVYVRLSSANTAGRYSGESELHLELIKLEFQGQSYPLVSSTYSLSGGSRGKNTAEKVGGGAVLGAIIGALAGGGKGAAIGAGAGAGAGGVYQGATKGKQVRIPSETKLDFQLDQPVTVSVMPRTTPATPAQ